MRLLNLSLPRLALLPICLLTVSMTALGQTPSAQSRIVDRVNESALVTLHGNTHPLAQAQFDQGAAPPDLSMQRMLLVLQRSNAQESALEALLDAQQDPSSPSYHQWLTADQFGQQFGPSDGDIQGVVTWLQSHGFQVARISKGRTVIEFAGTASQVQQAFHTEIHKYTINGAAHWANASDPQIPQALAPVVLGVNSLHNFSKTPAHHVAGVFSKSRVTGEVKALKPAFTIQDLNNCPGDGHCYFLSPADFATIYNVLPLWNATTPIDGTGENIAVIGRSDIVLSDVQQFRALFGLPPNDPNFIVDGTDPGVIPGDETEADLDVEWSGAVAKGAKINLVVAASTETTDGVDLASVYAVENNIAPIVSESFLQCELFLGTTGNAFANALREQAAAQGITFITASGDQGAAGCDFDDNSNPPSPATHGLMVNGLASSPYGIAVGGTDFLNFGPKFTLNSLQAASPYWNVTNNTQEASVIGYVPESTWNSTCTNNIYVVVGAGTSPEGSCNNSLLQQAVLVAGAGGGKSGCTTPSGSTPSSCSGGYAKPSWQSAPGVPADGKRDIPDVSLFASSGFVGSAYIICDADQTLTRGSCGLSGTDFDFLAVGGTSASAPAFAGIMALVNQSTHSAGQGNANHVLYKLASSSTQTNVNCNSSTGPASACIFNDVTSGTIEMPCAASSPNCNVSHSGDTYGILSGYAAAGGYDLATGLGSVNAANLVHNWSAPGLSTSTTLSLNSNKPVNVTHGQSVSLSVSVSPAAATGDVSLIGAPATGTSIAMGEFTLQNGAVSANTTALAGGSSYQVKAHYAGDSTYAPSDSAPVTVTVAPEPSATLITIPVFDPNTGRETADTPTSIVYGSPLIVRVDVGNAKAAVTFPMQPVCAPFACPTGSVTLSDSVSGGASGAFPLNSGGNTETQNLLLSGGAHQLTANYPGDSSYDSSSGGYTLAVTPAATQVTSPNLFGNLIAGSQYIASVTMCSQVLNGATPTGTITFFVGNTAIPGTVTLTGQAGTANLFACLIGSIGTSFATSGPYQLTAKYSGDSNYGPSTSPASTVNVQYSTTAMESASPSTINLGSSATITATVTSSAKNPPMTGTFQFFGSPAIPGPVTPTLTTDASGNQVLTATVTTSPQSSEPVQFNYSGDANFEGQTGSTFVTVSIPDFSLTPPSNPVQITAGQAGSVSIAVAPLGNMSSTVTVSCIGGAPIGYNCGVSPGTVNLSNGAGGSFLLTLTPTAPGPGAAFKRATIIHNFTAFPDDPIVLGGISLLVAIAGLLFLRWPVRRLRWRVVSGITIACAISLILGCGGGSSSGGGGGAPPPPANTTTTVMTSAAKVAANSQLTFTAMVTGAGSPTGSVNFMVNGGFYGQVNLIGNTATLITSINLPGLYTVTAQYGGDNSNNPSLSAGASQAVTGNSSVEVQAQTSTLNHFASVTVSLQ